MKPFTNRPRGRSYLLLLATLAFACDSGGGGGCDGGCGDGCGGTEGGARYEYPATAPVFQQAAQVHVTESGLSFIEDNAPSLVGSLVGGEGGEGLSFCIGEQVVDVLGLDAVVVCGGSNRCNDGSVGCELEIDIESIDLVPNTTPGAAADYLEARVGLGINDSLGVRLLGSNCNVSLSTPATGLPVSARVYFDVGAPPAERVSIRLPADELNLPIDDLGVRISGSGLSVIVCGGAGLLVNPLKGVLADQLTGPLEDALGPLLCQSCTTNADCSGGATCSDEVCVAPGSSECVPLPLGIETQIDLGAALADFAPGLEANLGILFYLANYADAVGPTAPPFPYVGLDLAGQLGVDTTPNACVPFRPAPDITRYAKSPELNAELNPAGGSFAVGIGIARRALDFAFWQVYNSGLLCLSIGSDTVEQLSTGTLGALVPSLGQLAEGENRPMEIRLRPQQPPTVTLGEGTVEYDADGTPRVVSPLLTLNIQQLHLDFYAFLEGRSTRVFTLDTDLALPLGLDVNADNQIVVLLPDDLTAAITRIDPINGELLAEADVARVAGLIPTLLGSLLPSLAGGLIDPIDLPEIEGIQLVLGPGSFTSVDSQEMLAIFADLALAEAAAKDVHSFLVPQILSSRVVIPSAERVSRELTRLRWHTADVDLDALQPTVELDLRTLAPGAPVGALEYSYRLNGGLWSFWHRGDTMRLRNPVFLLQGRYDLDVRVRPVGAPEGASPVLAGTTVVVDFQPPRVDIERYDQEIMVRATDLVSDPAELTTMWRVNHGAWQTLAPSEDRIDLAILAGQNALVEVRVTDAAGYTGDARKSFVIPASEPALGTAAGPAGDTSAPQAGCSATNAQGGGGWLLLALGAVFSFRRRLLAVAGVAALGAAAAGCGDDKGNTGVPVECSPACAAEQTCVNGVCLDCTADDDCAAGQTCEAGVCSGEARCESADDCDPGFLCVDNDCVTDTTCTSDEACGEGAICEDGTCVDVECTDVADCNCEAPQIPSCVDNACQCAPPCADGCAEGTACCFGSNSCVEVSTDCGEKECAPGTRLEAVADPVFDNGTCSATTDCECVELPALPIGFIGRWLDTAVSPDGASQVVVAYNTTYGDLMVGDVATDASIRWTFADGVPESGAITGSVEGPRGGIAVRGPDAGLYPSAALAADGTLHVSYQAIADDGPLLRYARGTKSGANWSFTFVDLQTGSLDGEFTRTLLDAAGNPTIVYAAPGVRLEDGTWASDVRVLRASSNAPADAAAFGEPLLVDRLVSSIPCGGLCAGRDECRLDTTQCQRSVRSSNCTPECGEGESCFENSDGARVCSASQSFGGLVTLREGAGLFLDARWLPDATLAVAHYDRSNGNLRYVVFDLAAGAATRADIVDGETSVDGVPTDTGDVGAWPSILVRDDGSVVIAYNDRTLGQLKAWDSADNTIQTVDDGFRCFLFDELNCVDVLFSRVGDDPALLDTGDGLSVVFQDATQHQIVESVYTEFGWQPPVPVPGAGGEETYTGAWGFYAQQVNTAAGRMIVSHRMNNRDTPPTRDVGVLR